MSELILKEEERVTLALRALYKKYGYLPYKMNKFEEYDLYVANKEFLVGDGVITFNDTDGKLLALKPDVTLSIIRNGAEGDGAQGKRKVCYDENVYRISAKTKQFKEIMQVGLECIGEIGLYDVYETVCLAAASLAVVSPKFVLDISHLGVLSAVLDSVCKDEGFQSAAMRFIAEKNAHETAALCSRYGVSAADTERLLALMGAYGSPKAVLAKIEPVCKGVADRAWQELCLLCELLSGTEYADNIRLDFSVVNDMNYYSDIVFKGFIDGIAEGVLSGGRYDKMMKRMGKDTGAIGFAVYLDLLEELNKTPSDTDVDVLVLYDDGTPTAKIAETVRTLLNEAESVRAQKCADGVRYKRLVDLTGKQGGAV